jgi:hypothetical protein
MELVGVICAAVDPPGIDRDRWLALIALDSRLSPVPPREGINPFTRKPTIFRAPPETARVHLDGEEAGGIEWSQSETHELLVFSTSSAAQAVAAVAGELAVKLDGEFRRSDDVETVG